MISSKTQYAPCPSSTTPYYLAAFHAGPFSHLWQIRKAWSYNLRFENWLDKSTW